MPIDGQTEPWPDDFPVDDVKGRIAEGLVVRSLSGEIEGRTTGGRTPCLSLKCDGWFIDVTWETGQHMRICSKGWAYDPDAETIQVTGGGEISARFVSPKPLGVPPIPRDAWPCRAELERNAGWRIDAGKRAGHED